MHLSPSPSTFMSSASGGGSEGKLRLILPALRSASDGGGVSSIIFILLIAFATCIGFLLFLLHLLISFIFYLVTSRLCLHWSHCAFPHWGPSPMALCTMTSSCNYDGSHKGDLPQPWHLPYTVCHPVSTVLRLSMGTYPWYPQLYLGYMPPNMSDQIPDAYLSVGTRHFLQIP